VCVCECVRAHSQRKMIMLSLMVMMQLCCSLLAVLLFLSSSYVAEVSATGNPLMDLDVNSERVMNEAAFALEELKKLSDSTIYSTLSLVNILSAQEQDGVFHHNLVLNVELGSPYFRSLLPKEKFEMIVMEHKEDRSRSFAIDEFPDMDERAIENFWVQKVEKKKKKREEAFRRLEIESLLLGEEYGVDKLPMKDKIDNNSVSDLLSVLDTDVLLEQRLASSSKFQGRLKNTDLLAEEKAIARMSLQELYHVTQESDATTYSDFQKYRAKQLLDASMLDLQQHLSNVNVQK
jgi:hypothetical protein